MKSSNSFSKGINQDISDLKRDGSTYLFAENFRIVSQGGQSTYALETTKGQSISFQLPQTVNAIYKIDPQNYTSTYTVSIGGITPPINVDYKLSPKATAEYLLTNTSIAALVTSGDIAVQYNNNYVVIVGLNNATTLDINGTSVSPFIQSISNPKIIGAINIKDYIIIFSTENTQNPNQYTISSTGQIWRLKYDENTNLVSGLVNNTLVPSVHLKYHNNLNWTQWKKISGEGRYETSDVQKVYFTDNFNSLSVFNTIAAQSFATPIETIYVKPLRSIQQPVIQSIQDGGFINSGVIQYFYQLQSALGTETTFSVPSELVPLSASSLNSGYEAYQGSTQGIVSGKSITFNITNIDTNYEVLNVGYILWQAVDVATVRIFNSQQVPSSGNITITHSGSETETLLTIDQYRMLQAAFDKCKGLAQKKNILLAFNTSTKSFDVDVDTRAYRYNSSQLSNLYDKEDTYGNPTIQINGSTSIWSYNGVAQTTPLTAIGQEFDLINPYNNEDNVNNLFNSGDWFTNSQFKYKADGLTLGGQGPVISYEFVDKGDQLPNGGSNNYTDYGDEFQSAPSNTSYGYPLIGGNMPNISGFTYSPGNGYSYSVNTGFSASKNPLLKALFTGYSSVEVYRFGIVFFNKKFIPSPVKWIGDIKFPFIQDGHDLFDWSNPGGVLGGYLNLRQLGIKFTIDMSQVSQSVKDEIIGWSFVRVKRNIKDKTRLGTGILNGVDSVTYSGISTYIPSPVNQAWPQGLDYVGGTTSNNIATIENPNFKFNIGNNYTGADYIRHLYTLTYSLAGNWLVNGSPTNVSVDKYYNRTATHSLTDIIPIGALFNIPVSVSKDIIAAGPGLSNPFINMSNQSGANFDSWGGYTHLLSTQNFSPAPNIWGVSGQPTSRNFRRLVSYERYLTNQYNGNTWEARLGQEYIGTNHFQPWDNSNLSASITNEIFGGDTLRTVFDWMKYDLNTTINNVSSGYNNSGTTQGNIQIFPSEVSFDLNLRQGFHAANKTGATGEPNHDEFIYNTAYSQENNAQLFFTLPFNFREVTEHPYRMWASQQKFDGEFVDSWAQWKSSDYGDAEGTHGPINAIILNQDKVYFYQDFAIAIEAVKEQQLLEGGTTALVLGEGSVLQRYDYVTKNTGCKHQWAVINTPKGNYHFDVALKKIFLLQETGDKFGLTDLKGLNTTLQNMIVQRVKDTDIPLIRGGVTIHAGWNPKHNEVFFTVLDNNTQNIGHIEGTGTTFTYNELTDSFDSFHSFHPSMYFRNQNRYFSISPGTLDNQLFEHDTGSYNIYYNQLQPSKLYIPINLPEALTVTKRLDIIELVTFVTDVIGNDVPFETFSTLKIYNNYQSTGLITLTPQVNIKKRFRSWRYNNIRDYANTPTTNPRLRDKNFILELTYNNVNNNRLVCNDVTSDLEIVPF